jgi:hypothetical protein
MIYWSTDRGNVLQYNTSASTNSSSFIPEAQNVTGGLTSVSGCRLLSCFLFASLFNAVFEGSNLMVFGANGVGPTLTSTPLDVLTKQVAGTTVVTQLSNFTAGSSQLANRTFSCITLNGALVAVTDAGIQLFFTPFSTVGVTRVNSVFFVLEGFGFGFKLCFFAACANHSEYRFDDPRNCNGWKVVFFCVLFLVNMKTNKDFASSLSFNALLIVVSLLLALLV